MKKILFIASVLFLSSNSYANTDCVGTKYSLEELRYMSVDELNKNYCTATFYQNSYLKRLQAGEYKLVDPMNVCKTNAEWTKRVLKKEYDEEPNCNAIHKQLSATIQ